MEIIQNVLDKEFKPAIGIKETSRINIKHPLGKLSKESSEKYEKRRRRTEQLLGTFKQTVGLSLKVLRGGLAKKWYLIVGFCGSSTGWQPVYFCLCFFYSLGVSSGGFV